MDMSHMPSIFQGPRENMRRVWARKMQRVPTLSSEEGEEGVRRRSDSECRGEAEKHEPFAPGFGSVTCARTRRQNRHGSCVM